MLNPRHDRNLRHTQKKESAAPVAPQPEQTDQPLQAVAPEPYRVVLSCRTTEAQPGPEELERPEEAVGELAIGTRVPKTAQHTTVHSTPSREAQNKRR